MDIVLYALTALLYGGLAVAGWRSHRHAAVRPMLESVPPVPVGTGLPASSAASGMSTSGRALLFVALLAHGVLLHTTIFPQNAMVFGFAFALSAMFWLGAGIYWIESFFFPLDGLRLLVLPLACVASLLPLAFNGVRVLPYSAAPMFKLHFLIANIAYGLFAIAALHAILMLLVERRLHAMRGGMSQRNAAAAGNGWLSSWLDTLPPLLTLEKLLFRLIGAGFVMLTLSLFTGFVFVTNLFTQHLIHKTVLSLIAWTIFGVLLIGRIRFGWRGRSAVGWTLSGFGVLALAYFGAKFVLEDVLGRHWG